MYVFLFLVIVINILYKETRKRRGQGKEEGRKGGERREVAMFAYWLARL